MWSPTALPFAAKPGPISRATVEATAASSMQRTELRAICCNTCRSKIDQDLAPHAAQSLEPDAAALSVTSYVEWVLGPSRVVVGARSS